LIIYNIGIKFLVGHKVTGGSNNGTHGSVNVAPVKGGDPIVLTADHILVSTGRRPYTDKLGAKEIGVAFDDKSRIIINSHF